MAGHDREDRIERKAIAALSHIRDKRMKDELVEYDRLFPTDHFRDWQYLLGILKRLRTASTTALTTAADVAAAKPQKAEPKPKPIPPIAPVLAVDGGPGLGPDGALSKKQVAAAKRASSADPSPPVKPPVKPAAEPKAKAVTADPGQSQPKVLSFLTTSGVPMIPAQCVNYLKTLTDNARIPLEKSTAGTDKPAHLQPCRLMALSQGRGKAEELRGSQMAQPVAAEAPVSQLKTSRRQPAPPARLREALRTLAAV